MKKLFYILTISLLALNCQKAENPVIVGRTLATLTTSGVSSITNTTAASGGNISSDGGSTITARGICWSTSPNPLIAGSHTTDGAGVGSFLSNMTGLAALTVYYVRAYSTNGEGTAYGNELSFTTTSTSTALATLTTSNVSQLTATTVSSGGNISNAGGALITARGVCWSTTTSPTTANSKTTDGAGTGTFVSTITGLSGGTTYYVRSYAINSGGTAYGNELTFTTIAPTTTPDVYVAGSIGYDAVLWKNGIANYLTNGSISTTASANSVFVTGTDVYVAGYQHSSWGDIAKVWKNGVATNLGGGLYPNGSSYDAHANSVFVSGTDVYVAGYAFNAAIIWKNGVATTLAGGTTNNYAEAFSVVVSGTDVYVAGAAEVPFPNSLAAKVWKNGIAINLTTNGSAYASAQSVFLSGTDVYVAGRERFSGSADPVGNIWKNSVATTLSNVFSGANSVFVSGTDIYVAGTGGVQQVATVWKNGVVTYLSNVSGKANSVFVYGTDVYVAGGEYGSSGNTAAKVWKNGLPINLTSGTTNSVANSIYVK